MIDNTANSFAALFGSVSDADVAAMDKPGRGKAKVEFPAWMSPAVAQIDAKGFIFMPADLYKKKGQLFQTYVKGAKVKDSNPAVYENGVKAGSRLTFEARATAGKTAGYVVKIVKV